MTIGRWCDRMILNQPKYNRTMAIVITNDGKTMLKSKFSDGSSSTNELRGSSGQYLREDWKWFRRQVQNRSKHRGSPIAG